MADFANPMNPAGRLTPPGDYSGQVKQDIDNALGMIHYIVNIIDHFTGWNIEEELTNWVGGNYGQLLSIRDAWNCCGWAVGDINSNLGSGLTTAAGHWSGNAADGFHNYMNEWTTALNEDRDACFAIRDQLTNLAAQARDMLTTILQAIKTIVGLVSAAGASIDIPIWGEYKIGKAIWEAVKLINNVRKVVSAFINTVKMVIDTVHEITDLVHAKNPTIRVDIPAAAYGGPSNPGV